MEGVLLVALEAGCEAEVVASPEGIAVLTSVATKWYTMTTKKDNNPIQFTKEASCVSVIIVCLPVVRLYVGCTITSDVMTEN